MPVEIRPAGSGDLVRMMLYAYPSTGKSSLLATAAEAGLKVLVIRSSMDLLPRRVLGTGVQEAVCDHWEEMTEIEERLMHEGDQWDIVSWDCISVAEDALLDDVWEGTIAEKPARNWIMKEGKKLKPNLSPSSGLDQGEYGRNMERIGRHVRHMVGMRSFHYIVTAHVYEGPHPVDVESDAVLLQPWIQGKNMIPKICGYMNMVGFMELKDNGEQQWRRLHVKESPRWYAKDLFDAFPNGFIDNPTLPRIIEATRGRMAVREEAKPAAVRAGRGRGANVTPIAAPRGRRGRREQ